MPATLPNMIEIIDDMIKRSTLDQYLEASVNSAVNMENGGGLNSTTMIINSLFLLQVQQQRYMHIALGAVSMALASWVIFRIWYDSWRSTKLQSKLRHRKYAFLTELHPAESLPLVLAFVSFGQTMIFVVIQALALKSIFVKRCVATSQIIFPAIFVLSYVHLVYGFEMTIRSLKRNPFQPRRKCTNLFCAIAIIVLTIATWIPTRIWPNEMACLGDIIWRPFRNVRTGAGISSGLIFAFITMAAIIGIQLYNTRNIDPDERIAGSRMFYYLVGSAILQVFVAPFFIQGVAMTYDSQFSSSRIAEFILFTTGSFLALLHLILRANASLFAIKPKSTPWHRKRKFRLFGPSDLELLTISAPMNLIHDRYSSDEKVQDLYSTKIMSPLQPLSTFSLQLLSPEASTPRWPLPLPSPAAIKSPRISTPLDAGPSQEQSTPGYQTFPAGTEEDIVQLPATTYSPPPSSLSSRRRAQTETGVKAPLTIQPSAWKFDVSDTSFHVDDLLPPGHPWTNSSHHRSSSADSSATVQIGIRLSNAAAVLATSNSDPQSIIVVSPKSADRPSSSLQRSYSVPQSQLDGRPLESPPLPISKERPKRTSTKHDSQSKDSTQSIDLQRLQTASSQPSEALLYPLPRLAPSKEDRLTGFF